MKRYVIGFENIPIMESIDKKFYTEADNMLEGIIKYLTDSREIKFRSVVQKICKELNFKCNTNEDYIEILKTRVFKEIDPVTLDTWFFLSISPKPDKEKHLIIAKFAGAPNFNASLDGSRYIYEDKYLEI